MVTGRNARPTTASDVFEDAFRGREAMTAGRWPANPSLYQLKTNTMKALGCFDIPWGRRSLTGMMHLNFKMFLVASPYSAAGGPEMAPVAKLGNYESVDGKHGV
ncbi:uncharacterized protein TRIVIDRAFT_67169 [Trichoderma virens Gv29-8]|uniref:Uncharacterized protein n=1 Tax=Hypocrea virens (strain Gv29-8 / FGSC 10586) TaxID=413071 RepID=G9N5A1_HYPVG|nr:uncharacterized protein TRIVIDRAFT_67169 [Trichoderma virens Gv29-8]EHK17946.1 hypothetical protein TRIVIDRAFT_67169 [Trichoderma virens Gv29-8]UKZ54189.1 hypothetical protein TrVGV298_007996 [Trichoderma virens]